MKNTQTKIEAIAKGATAQNINYTKVLLTTKSAEEYELLCTEILSAGKLVEENNFKSIFDLNNDISVEGSSINQIHIIKPQSELALRDGVVVDINATINLEIQNIETADFGIDIAYKLDDDFMVYKESLIEIAEDAKQENQKEDIAAQLQAEKERRLMLMADFENYKKRVESERATFAAIGNISLIQSILEVFDDLQLAMSDENLNIESAKQAIQGAQNKIQTTTKIAGVEQVEVKVGDDFDKEKMEAVSTIPAQDENQKGKVIAVIASAYKYVGRDGIVKPAKVVVGK